MSIQTFSFVYSEFRCYRCRDGVFPCFGQSVRETELVSLHQLTAPPVTMSTSGCALRCLYLLYWRYLTCPYPSARIHSKCYCIYSWGSYDKSTEPSVTMSRSGCPNHVLSLVIPDSIFMAYYGDGCSPITMNNIFLCLGWSNSTLDGQSRWTPGGS